MMSFMSQLHQGWQDIKGLTQGGGGSQFWDFRCRAYRAKLIPSGVLQCAPTLGQPRILYLLTAKMCLVTYYSQLASSCNPTFVFIDFSWFEWPSSQWAWLKGLEYLATRTAVLYQSWQRLEEEGSGSSWPPTPLIVKLWHIYECTLWYI